MLAVAAGLLLSAGARRSGPNLSEYLILPVIPDWVQVALVQPVVPSLSGRNSMQSSGPSPVQPVGTALNATGSCLPDYQFVGVPEPYVAIRFDSSRNTTEVYVGDYMNDRILRHDLTPAGVHSVTPLPLPYRVCWLAEDLDRDGLFELVLQNGDLGLGGNGYLEIRSSPDWHLRALFTYPGMKTVMRPVSFQLDDDDDREVFFVATGGGPSLLVVIDYDSTTGQFFERSASPGIEDMGGRRALADFDSDGRVEVISGTSFGYALYEWRDLAFEFVSRTGDTAAGNHLCAAALNPVPDSLQWVLLGHSGLLGHAETFSYELMRCIGDNLFETQKVFAETTAFIGITPCAAADINCDGLDETVMSFFPNTREFHWDFSSRSFTAHCAWDKSIYGTLSEWYTADLNRDSRPEWIALGSNTFRSFETDSCLSCDSGGQCLHQPRCDCSCHGDLNCDRITDVVDVVSVIQETFRAGIPTQDSRCPHVSRSDANCDCIVNVVDVVISVGVAFRGVPIASSICHPCVNSCL